MKKIQAQKGTKDILPSEIANWQFMENVAINTFNNANYREIRTPIFEATELFARGVGDSTDIVNKEMYTFEKSDRSLTLRPEGTASVVRAYIEHGFFRMSSPQKFWYKGPMFRYERPQAGRQRQFHQVGVEFFGEANPTADAEVILSACTFLNNLGLNDLTVEINSLGCDKCRSNFRENLKKILLPKLENLCDDCKMRYEKNPLRILDCKNETCLKELASNDIEEFIQSDFICDECSEHYITLKKYLDELNIKYVENKKLVRGLDYYNRTVFEIKSNNLGSQNAVCGGGRYDNLVETLGGPQTPAVGFAMGLERLNLLINQLEEPKLDYFVISTNTIEALKLVNVIRKYNKSVDFDYSNKKFTKQFEKAAKTANFALILGEDELKSNTISIKDLKTSNQKTIGFSEFLKTL